MESPILTSVFGVDRQRRQRSFKPEAIMATLFKGRECVFARGD